MCVRVVRAVRRRERTTVTHMGCHERAVTPPAPGVLGGGGRALYGGGKNASLGLAASSLSRRTNRTSFFSTSRRTHSVCGSRFGYPSYLLHARQVHGFRHRQLVRGGHRPAFRLRCFDGRVTRCQRACGDKTYAENIDRRRRRFAKRKTTKSRADAVVSTTASPSTRSHDESVPYLVLHTHHLLLCPCHP